MSLQTKLTMQCVQTTTIEGSEIDKVKKMVRRGKITEVSDILSHVQATTKCCVQVVYPFNVGILANVTSTIGHTPIEWLFTGKPTGDGLSYPCAEDSGTFNKHSLVERKDR